MSQAGARAPIVRSALEAAVTRDEALVERVYTDDVTGWSPTATASSRADLLADLRGRKGVFSDVELRGVLIAEFEGDRIKRFRQYWDEVALLEGLGLLPED
jgi:hypothetical protein